MECPTPNAKTIHLTITALGGLGDGIGHTENGTPVFVPLTCVGDEIRARITQQGKGFWRAEVDTLLKPSLLRQTPPCEYFAQCGGCSLQQMDDTAYHAFKAAILPNLLNELGAHDAQCQPCIHVGPHSRRRVEVKVSVNKGVVDLGFFARKSHHLVAITHCLVSEPAIANALPLLKQTLEQLKKPGRITSINLTALDYGLDGVITARTALHNADIATLQAIAPTLGWVRLCLQMPDGLHMLYDSGNARVTFGDVAVELPVGAFLQAAQAGQAAISEWVCQRLYGCHTVLDLFSGCGTYSFALHPQTNRISAYEGVREMVEAIHNAAQSHGLGNKISATTRDLFRSPLPPEQLNHYDGVVINPPRAGARTQCAELAKSRVKRVVMVSCNPATFMRDAAEFLHAGWRLTHAVSVDQFYWSGHLELIAAFENPSND